MSDDEDDTFEQFEEGEEETEENIESILSKMSLPGIEDLNVKELLELEFSDGKKVFSFENKLYFCEFVALLKNENNLKEKLKRIETPIDLILSDLAFKDARNSGLVKLANEIFEEGKVLNSNIKCKRCQSNNTEVTEAQVRSADEPTTTFVHCRDCGVDYSIRT